MPPTISLTSSSFTNGGLLPPEFKNNIFCTEANRSPEFTWTYGGGIIPAFIEHFNLYVENNNVAGSSPNGKFLHWGIQQISVNQTNIAEDGAWIGGGVVVLPTDYPTGDRTNGWNGPCTAIGAPNVYRAWIEVKLTSEACAYLWPNVFDPPPANCLLKSAVITFTDNSNNISVSITTADCGTEVCPPGYTLVDGVCQQTIITTAISNPENYAVQDAASSANYCTLGTRFYENADQYIFPLRGTPIILIPSDAAVLKDANGTGTILPYTLDNVSALWKSVDAATGRLNLLGVWANTDHPTKEWIGISKCLTVTGIPTKYCIGIGTASRAKVKLDGDTIIRLDVADLTAHSTYWHIVEITLDPGNHILEFFGYVDHMINAALGFEVYKATAQQLMALTTTGQLAASGYVQFTSADEIGNTFNVGQNTGYTCPIGYAFNACNGINCIDINYVEPTYVNCCWLIRRCDGSIFEEYLIQLGPLQTLPLYIGNIYSFSNGGHRLDGKCFTVIDRVICDAPDIMGVIVQQDFERNCAACSPSIEFQSCTTGTSIYISLVSGGPPIIFIPGWLYRLDIDNLCYTYVGLNYEHLIEIYNVTVVDQFQLAECNVCNGCALFQQCGSETIITVQFASVQTLPLPTTQDIDTIYILSGFGQQALCWIFKGYVDCIGDFIPNIIIAEHKECPYCTSCMIYYKLTNCTDPTDTLYIYWDGSILSSDESYVFDFAPDICYKVEFQNPPCEDTTPVVYDDSNIITTYSQGCDECNALCYRLRDCDTGMIIAATSQDFSGYIGYIIQWTDDQQVMHCTSVEEYVCRTEQYPMIVIHALTCFSDCEECNPPVIPDPEFSIKHRAVSPGYTTPECSTGSSCNSCSSSEPCEPCTPCDNN